MQLTELLLIAIGVAMDAFAVAIGKGLTMKRVRLKDAVLVGLWFGAFQFLMPVAGFFLGSRFLRQIEAFDHWAAFGILAAVGGNMIREALQKQKEDPDTEEKQETGKTDLRVGTMFLLAVATSIDALAIGITFGLLRVRILPAASFIGGVTFAISLAGVYVGSAFGARFKKSAALAGGVVLIVIGVKILLEHLGVIA